MIRRLSLLLLSLLLLTSFSSAAEGWPREFTSPHGKLILKKAPKRILSTSVTLTGSLLAIDAPVIASGAAMPGKRFTDDQGFFRQWGAVARERGVEWLYSSEPNLEVIAAAAPDLIVVSATGNDSALGLVDQLAAIAPTLVVNYDDKSWQQVVTELGRVTGHEQQAEQKVNAFNLRVKTLRDKLTLPPQPVSAFVYNPSVPMVNLWTPASAQGKLLQQLGFSLATPPAAFQRALKLKKRQDILPLSGEALVTGLTGNSFLMFAAEDKQVKALRQQPLLAASPAVIHQQVYALGDDSFRLDYYSASNLLTRIETLFGRH